jgi:hypothetical protein
MTDSRGPIYVQVIGGPATEKKRLDSSLTIGTENTDIALNHPHLSPLHCTLFNRGGIISVIDHNSDYGISINGKRIAPNKMIILMEGDQVTCGELEIKLYDDPTNTLSLNINETESLVNKGPEQTVIISRPKEDEIVTQITRTQLVPEGFIPPGTPQKIELENDTEVDEKTQIWEQMSPPGTQSKVVLDLEDSNPQPTPTSQPVKMIKVDTEELSERPKELEPQKEMEFSKQSIKLGNKIGFSKNKNAFASHKKLKPKHRSLPTLMDMDSISIPVRIAAFLIDIILSIRLVQFLTQEDMLDEIKVVQEIAFFGIDFFLEQTKINFDPSYALQIIGPYVAVFLIIRVLSAFIFGVSIGQLLCGVRSEGNLLLKRIFAPLREILGVFTGPFLIFDIPGLFSKKTFKEIITLSKMYQSSRLSYLLMMIMPPLIFGICYLGPMLDGEEHFHVVAMDLKTEVISLKPGTNIPDELAPRRIPIQFLQAQFPVGNAERTIALTINKSNQDNKTRPFPGIKVLYTDPSLILTWQKTKILNLAELLSLAVNPKNGWIERKFPELKKYVNGEKYDRQTFITEFKTICQDAFTLEWKTLPFTLVQYGPFYVGLLNLRQALFSPEGLNGPISNFKIIQIQDEFLLQIDNAATPTLGKLNLQWLTLATGKYSSLYKLDVRSEKAINWEEEQKQLKEKYLSLLKIENPQKIQVNQMSFPTDRMFTMGEIVDYFAQGQKKILDQSILLPRISEHLKKVGEKLIQQKSIFLLEEYKREIAKLVDWMKELLPSSPDSAPTAAHINQFIQDLQSILTLIDSSIAQVPVQLPESPTPITTTP